MCKIVAEIGTVHLGDINRAKVLIKLAKDCGAHYAKFQKRNPIESVPIYLQNKPHPNAFFSYGSTYLDHRNKLELTIEEHVELKKYCEQIGIGYASSVWDKTSAEQIISLNPDYIKIPSACNLDFELLDLIYSEFNGKIHISLGMLNNSDLKNFFEFIRPKINRTVLYHCTSEYPCPFEHLYLKNILLIKNVFESEIGFSDHGFGIAASVVAYSMGASWIERHFVDDRTLRHSDAASSLEPSGLTKLCRDIKNIEKAMKYKNEISEAEKTEMKKLRRIND